MLKELTDGSRAYWSTEMTGYRKTGSAVALPEGRWVAGSGPGQDEAACWPVNLLGQLQAHVSA